MLTPDQLQAINHHLRKENWLLNEDLIAELTDHYVAGLEDRLTQGTNVNVAIREVHAGFGGRKGLLKMEEDFQKSQVRNSGRITRNLLVAYFRLPRLGITFLILILVYSLIQLLPNQLYFSWSDRWVFVGLLAGLSILYISALTHLFTKQKHKASPFNQTVQLMMQGITSLLTAGSYIRVWLPVDQMLIRFPLPSSVVITLFVIFELATIELLFNQIYLNRAVKTA